MAARRGWRSVAAQPRTGSLAVALVVAAVLVVASSAFPASASLARAPRKRAVSLAACLSGALSPGGAGSSGTPASVVVRANVVRPATVGTTALLRASYTCAAGGVAVPIVGLLVEVTADPAGIVALSHATRVTNGDGVAAYAARTLGLGRTTLEVHGVGLCRRLSGRGCRLFLHLVASARGPGTTRAATARWRHLGIVPPGNPTHNAPVLAPVPTSCGDPAPMAPAASQPAAAFGSAARCTAFFLRGIDAARAAEGVGPMVLPSDWARLTGAEQLFVLADLERVDRGLPPYVGLSASLDGASQQAAEAGTDPSLALPLVAAAAGNWAGDVPSTLAADYDWLYVDGFGSGNESCSAPGAPGCWGHRDGILGAVTGLGCTDCVMGAGSALASGSGWRTSFAEIVAEPVRPGAMPTFFTWQHDVLPYLHAAPPG